MAGQTPCPRCLYVAGQHKGQAGVKGEGAAALLQDGRRRALPATHRAAGQDARGGQPGRALCVSWRRPVQDGQVLAGSSAQNHAAEGVIEVGSIPDRGSAGSST